MCLRGGLKGWVGTGYAKRKFCCIIPGKGKGSIKPRGVNQAGCAQNISVSSWAHIVWQEMTLKRQEEPEKGRPWMPVQRLGLHPARDERHRLFSAGSDTIWIQRGGQIQIEAAERLVLWFMGNEWRPDQGSGSRNGKARFIWAAFSGSSQHAPVVDRTVTGREWHAFLA